MKKNSPPIEKYIFKTKRDKSGCLVWTGYVSNSGYGSFMINGKNVMVHRWAFENFIAPIKPQNDICHKCDNRLCVEPSHLFQGTRLDNMKDCVRKNRHAHGETTYSKLTEQDVLEIKYLSKNGWGSRIMSAFYPVSERHIRSILQGKRWRHLNAA